MYYYINALRNYFKFDGRASRREFWAFFLINYLIACVWIVVDACMGWSIPSVSYGYLTIAHFLLTLVPSYCVQIRRLHDVGKSGSLLWLSLVPVLNLYIAFLMLKKGDDGSNRYGEPPVRKGKRRKQPEEPCVDFPGERETAATVEAVREVSQEAADCSLDTNSCEERKMAEQAEFSGYRAQYCKMCGERLFEDNRFCHRCGTEVISGSKPSADFSSMRASSFAEDERYREIPVLKHEPEEKLHSNGKTKKIFAVILIVAICGGGGYFGVRYGGPYLKYMGAIGDMRNGNAEKAMETFICLGDYRDSESLVTEASYLWAMSMFENGEYLKAQEQFETHRRFKESGAMIKACKYELGKNCFAEGKYDEALPLLFGAESDEALQLVVECYYKRMMRHMEEGDWSGAYKDYKHVLEYDTFGKMKVEQYQYQVYTEYAKEKAREGTNSGCKEALDVLDTLIESVGENEDLKELRQSAVDTYAYTRYKTALKLIQNKWYNYAVDELSHILDYKDSEKYWLEAMYQFLAEFKAVDSVVLISKPEDLERRMDMYRGEIYEYAKTLYAYNYKGERNYYSQLMKLTKN